MTTPEPRAVVSPASELWTTATVEVLVAMGATHKPADGGSFPSMQWETPTPQGRLTMNGYLTPGSDWHYFVTHHITGAWKQRGLYTQDLTEAYAQIADILDEASAAAVLQT